MLSPFGGDSTTVVTFSAAHVREMYKRKCGMDVTASFAGVSEVTLHECSRTGYRFWRPADVAGDEVFYQELSRVWADYYRPSRWEYEIAKRFVLEGGRVLEVGCGRGYFLRSLEGAAVVAEGLELNREAIENKVTSFHVRAETIDELARKRPNAFDVVCCFQVLEHVIAPGDFLRSCLAALKPGGLLVVSTPNNEHVPLASYSDAFDLPPHHMGQFTPAVFRRMASLLDTALIEIVREPRRYQPEGVTDGTRENLLYRLAVKATGVLLDASYRMSGEPGANLLAALRKGSD